MRVSWIGDRSGVVVVGWWWVEVVASGSSWEVVGGSGGWKWLVEVVDVVGERG